MEILEKILTDKLNREKLIADFQNQIWNDENALEVLRDLAYDLDYYVQDETLRKELPNYYGDERLEIEISSVIQKLKELNL